MTELPPPDPSQTPVSMTPEGPPAEPPTGPSTRTKMALAAAVAATVAVGGVAIGSQFASADRASIASTSATQTDDPVDDESDTDDSSDSDDTTDDDTTIGDVVSLPDDFVAQVEAYDACLAEQLPEVFGDGGLLDVPFTGWNGTVTVSGPGVDDGAFADDLGGFTLVEFGDGDGSVTITKTGDDISVTTSGDATTVDMSKVGDEFDAAWDQYGEQIKAAEQACRDLLPDIGAIDVDLGELDELIDLGELGPKIDELLGDLDSGELESKIDEMFENFDSGDFEMRLDELLGDLTSGDLEFGQFGFDEDGGFVLPPEVEEMLDEIFGDRDAAGTDTEN